MPEPMRCPVCKAENSQGPQCRRCKADLSLLFALEDQRRQAVEETRAHLGAGRFLAAGASAERAHALRADSHSGQLLALTALLAGDFASAWRHHGLSSNDPETPSSP